MAYNIQSYKINEDGSVVGVDEQGRTIAIGQLTLITVENPNGLEKTSGYYYNIGPNAGTIDISKQTAEQPERSGEIIWRWRMWIWQTNSHR